jgi:hypothetical protein
MEWNNFTYPVRGESMRACALAVSEDSRLVVATCYQDGLHRVDVFDGSTQERLASFDIEHDKGGDRLGVIPSYTQFLGNRWFAISTEDDLRTILLFDFERHFQAQQAP